MKVRVCGRGRVRRLEVEATILLVVCIEFQYAVASVCRSQLLIFIFLEKYAQELNMIAGHHHQRMISKLTGDWKYFSIIDNA